MWQNILQSLQQELNRLSATLSFAPAWAIWAALLVLAAICLFHADRAGGPRSVHPGRQSLPIESVADLISCARWNRVQRFATV